MIPNSLIYKLLGAAIAAAFLLWLWQSRAHWKVTAEARGVQIAEICKAAADASNNPKLHCRDTAAQVRHLGEALDALRTSLDRQNAAVEALGRRSAESQAEAARASQVALERARAAEGARDRLLASSRSGAARRGDGTICEPSEAVRETWR